MRVPVSKHLKDRRHVGFKKFVAGWKYHLITGTTAEHERVAEHIAHEVVVRAQARAGTGRLTKADLDECKRLGREAAGEVTVPHSMEAAESPPARSRSLYAVMERYKQDERERADARQCKPATAWSNQENIEQAKGIVIIDGRHEARGIADIDMNDLNGPELTRWVRFFRGKPVLRGSRPISGYRASNIIATIRHFLRFAKREQYWRGFEDWREAFARTSPKSLMDRIERHRAKAKKKINFTLQESQILWNLSLSRAKAFFGLALWGGHTQNELATIIHDEFVTRDGELFLVREREKTGVEGEWWIPPEVAQHVRRSFATRDAGRNPKQLAFLGGNDLPVVQWHADKDPTDSVAQAWDTVLRKATHWDVRHISFKYARKTMAQQIRLELDESYATLFCAQEINSIQAEHYSQPDPAVLLKAMREVIYPKWRRMFEKVNWRQLRAELDAGKKVGKRADKGVAA